MHELSPYRANGSASTMDPAEDRCNGDAGLRARQAG